MWNDPGISASENSMKYARRDRKARFEAFYNAVFIEKVILIRERQFEAQISSIVRDLAAGAHRQIFAWRGTSDDGLN